MFFRCRNNRPIDVYFDGSLMLMEDEDAAESVGYLLLCARFYFVLRLEF
jgi:hypothetical protein